MNQEKWLPVTITGFENLYSISTLGRVRNDAPRRGATVGKIKKATPNMLHRYLTVMLSNAQHDIRVPVHRLVALAFIPNPDGKPMVNHKDGDRANPRVENLEWVTCSENHNHAFRQLGKKSPQGEENGNAQMTAGAVRHLRYLHGIGRSQKELAEMYGINNGTVSRIIHRTAWKHVE